MRQTAVDASWSWRVVARFNCHDDAAVPLAAAVVVALHGAKQLQVHLCLPPPPTKIRLASADITASHRNHSCFAAASAAEKCLCLGVANSQPRVIPLYFVRSESCVTFAEPSPAQATQGFVIINRSIIVIINRITLPYTCRQQAKPLRDPAHHLQTTTQETNSNQVVRARNKKTNSTHTHTHQRTREQPAAVSCWLRMARG